MYFYLVLGILAFIYYKSRIYTNPHDSCVVFKRYNLLKITKKIIHPLTPIKYDSYKYLKYGNNFLWPLIDTISYGSGNNPITIPISKKSIDFDDIKIYENECIVLKIKFISYFYCVDIEKFFKALDVSTDTKLANGFDNIIEKIIIDKIKDQTLKINDLSQFTNIFQEKQVKDNETKLTGDVRTMIWTYINIILKSSVLSTFGINSSSTQIVSMKMNSIVNF